jgi:hypothetical protein
MDRTRIRRLVPVDDYLQLQKRFAHLFRPQRDTARLAAIQALYQMEVSGVGAEAVVREFIDHRFDADMEGEPLAQADEEFFAQIVRGVVADQARIDQMIDEVEPVGFDLVVVDFHHLSLLNGVGQLLEKHRGIVTLGDGELDLVVPAGTQHGKQFVARGRGVPHLQGRGRGNLIVRVAVVVPTSLSQEQEQLLRQLAQVSGDEIAPPDKSLLSKIKSAFT